MHETRALLLAEAAKERNRAEAAIISRLCPFGNRGWILVSRRAYGIVNHSGLFCFEICCLRVAHPTVCDIVGLNATTIFAVEESPKIEEIDLQSVLIFCDLQGIA